jgi:actin cytoskeleton-regulatory complex protein PAN1
LAAINEHIREQESYQRLESLSNRLFIKGQGWVFISCSRLDFYFIYFFFFVRFLQLTEPTRNMGQRKLIKEGAVLKAKNGKKLRLFLCNDLVLLTDPTANTLYRTVSVFVYFLSFFFFGDS